VTGITPAPLRALRRRVAVLVGEVLSPGVLVTVALPLVGWTGTRSLTGVGWGLFAALCCVAVPYIVLFLGVRRGYWQDHHLRDRRQRTVPFLIATGCALTGCAVLLLLDAPPHRPGPGRRHPGRTRQHQCGEQVVEDLRAHDKRCRGRHCARVHLRAHVGSGRSRGRARRLVAGRTRSPHGRPSRCGRTPRGGGVRHSLRAPALTTKSRSAPVPPDQGSRSSPVPVRSRTTAAVSVRSSSTASAPAAARSARLLRPVATPTARTPASWAPRMSCGVSPTTTTLAESNGPCRSPARAIAQRTRSARSTLWSP